MKPQLRADPRHRPNAHLYVGYSGHEVRIDGSGAGAGDGSDGLGGGYGDGNEYALSEDITT